MNDQSTTPARRLEPGVSWRLDQMEAECPRCGEWECLLRVKLLRLLKWWRGWEDLWECLNCYHMWDRDPAS